MSIGPPRKHVGIFFLRGVGHDIFLDGRPSIYFHEIKPMIRDRLSQVKVLTSVSEYKRDDYNIDQIRRGVIRESTIIKV